RTPRLPVRRAPSLARELIAAILLRPELARTVALPRSADGTPEGNALAALVDACCAPAGGTSPPGGSRQFPDSVQEPVLAAALATAEDHALTADDAQALLTE